jgi:DNA-directed RNA polymerase subunit RPC12/RpoP
MRVVKSGVVKEWTYDKQVTCHACQSVLDDITLEDLHTYDYMAGPQWDEYVARGVKIVCPECSSDIVIDAPHVVVKAVKQREAGRLSSR